VSIAPSASNSSVGITALRPGEAILRVFSPQAETLDDFVKFKVGEVIEPAGVFVHIGGTIQFSVALKQPEDIIKRISWTSEQPNIISIDGQTGLAYAKHIGKTQIHYNSSIHTYTTVEVMPVSKIIVGVRVPFVTNVRDIETGQPEQYRFPLTFIDSSGRAFQSQPSPRQIQHNIFVECKVVETDWATASSYRDPETGVDCCLLTPHTPQSIDEKGLGARMIDSLALLVKVHDMNNTYEISHREIIPYAPAFIIRGKTKLELTHSKRSVLVEVHTKSALFVTSSDERVSVRKYLSETISPHTEKVFYEISVTHTNEPFTDVSVLFFNPVTEQKEEVLVSFGYDVQLIPVSQQQQQQEQQQQHEQGTRGFFSRYTSPSGSFPGFFGSSSNTFMGLVISACVGLLVAVVVMVVCKDEKRSRAGAGAGGPASTPVTPRVSGGGGFTSLTPTTTARHAGLASPAPRSPGIAHSPYSPMRYHQSPRNARTPRTPAVSAPGAATMHTP